MDLKLDKEELDRLFYIHNGCFYWRRGGRLLGRAAENKRAGWVDEQGYRYIGIKGKLYQEHQLMFLYYHGCIPALIDHIDRDPSNNHIDNLREADKAINSINRGLQANNTSGIRGVGFNKASGKWVAYIKVDGKNKHLGLFETIELAAQARLEAETQYWPA